MVTDLQARLATEGSVTFTVHVKPAAVETLLVGTLDDGTLKIALKAPPEGGRANRELLRFLSEEFSVPMDCVDILAGAGTRRKLVRVSARP